MTLTLSQIQADMRDVAFYYRKKGGLKISDSGLADVFLGGKGITVKVTLTSTADERAHGASLFRVKDVKVKVDALKFAIRDVRCSDVELLLARRLIFLLTEQARSIV